MNKSLMQRVMDLEKRLQALEAKKIEPMQVTIFRPPAPTVPVAPEPTKPARNMCPKCGVKPNYFFHVKTCTGQRKEQKNADTEPGRNPGKA